MSGQAGSFMHGAYLKLLWLVAGLACEAVEPVRVSQSSKCKRDSWASRASASKFEQVRARQSSQYERVSQASASKSVEPVRASLSKCERDSRASASELVKQVRASQSSQCDRASQASASKSVEPVIRASASGNMSSLWHHSGPPTSLWC